MRGLSPIAVLLALAASASAQQSSSPVGVWELWSVDGLPVSQQLPSRDLGGIFELVAEDMFGKDNAWTETTIDSLSIHFIVDGEYRLRMVSTTTYVLRAEAYEHRFGRRAPPGQQFIRETQAPQVRESLGTWRIEGDSVFLSQTLEQIAAEYAATDGRLIHPEKPPDELLRTADEAIARTGLTEAMVPPRYAGILRTERLDLRAVNGLRLTFRRQQ